LIKYLPYKKLFISGIGAFVIYALWAYYSNEGSAVRSAFMQGSMSFFMTIFLAIMLEFIYKKASAAISAIIFALLLIWSIMTLQAIVHYVIGTDNIFMTILPGLLLGTVYVIVYLVDLDRKK